MVANKFFAIAASVALCAWRVPAIQYAQRVQATVPNSTDTSIANSTDAVVGEENSIDTNISNLTESVTSLDTNISNSTNAVASEEDSIDTNISNLTESVTSLDTNISNSTESVASTDTNIANSTDAVASDIDDAEDGTNATKLLNNQEVFDSGVAEPEIKGFTGEWQGVKVETEEEVSARVEFKHRLITKEKELEELGPRLAEVKECAQKLQWTVETISKLNGEYKAKEGELEHTEAEEEAAMKNRIGAADAKIEKLKTLEHREDEVQEDDERIRALMKELTEEQRKGDRLRSKLHT